MSEPPRWDPALIPDPTAALEAQLLVFAKRATEIARFLDEERPATPAARDAVKLKNRPRKIDVPRDELVSRWRGEAVAAGLEVDSIVREAASGREGRDRTPAVAGRASETLSRLRRALADVCGTQSGRDPDAAQSGGPLHDAPARRFA